MASLKTRYPLVHPSSVIGGTLQNFAFSATGQALVYMIQAPAARSYDTIYIGKASGGAAGQTYRFGLKSPDSSTGGVVLGATWLGATGNGFADVTNPTTGDLVLTLGEPVSLTKGQIVAVVVETTAGTPTAAFRYGQQFNNVARFGYCANFNGTVWSFVTVSPAVAIGASGAVDGETYYPASTTRTVATGAEIASVLLIPSGAGTSWLLSQIEINLATITGAGTLDILWYPGTNATDTTGTTLLSITGSYLTRASASVFRFILTTDQVITPGSAGRLSIKNSTGSNIQIVSLDYPDTASMATQVGGTANYVSTRNGGNWTDIAQSKLALVPIFTDITAAGAGGVFLPRGMQGGYVG